MNNSLKYIALVLLTCCSSPIDVEVRDTQQLLVVDASLTNELKNHEVLLSFSSALDGEESLPFTNAQVWISDELGNQYNFSEQESGTYVSDQIFAAQESNSYVLRIVSEDGRQYKTTSERLPPALNIDNIFGEYVITPSTEDAGIDEGIQFFINSSSSSTEVFNVRIEYEEDYVIRVPYATPYVYNVGSGIEPRDTLIQTCYNNLISTELLIGSTGGQTENRLADFPIKLVSPSEPQLRLRYALTVRQYSISAEAYSYYQDLKENNESGGGFFDIQKGSVFGNIFNINDDTEPVLGYFEVANTTTSRTFFVPSEWRDDGFFPDLAFVSCEYTMAADSVFTVDVLNDLVQFGTRNIHAISMDGVFTILVPQFCSDCRLYGSLTKPEFWD